MLLNRRVLPGYKAERFVKVASSFATTLDVINKLMAFAGFPGNKLTISNCYFQGEKVDGPHTVRPLLTEHLA
jgi:hypothetical protein